MMQYKGYVAAVEFDDSVGCLHGRVVNSGAYPIATFEATDVDGIRREFQKSIDEYLASLPGRRRGRAEESRSRGTLNLRLGPDLHQRAALSGHCPRREPEQLDQAGGGGEGRPADRAGLENRELIADSRSMSTARRHSMSQLCVRDPHVDLAGDCRGDQSRAELLEAVGGFVKPSQSEARGARRS